MNKSKSLKNKKIDKRNVGASTISTVKEDKNQSILSDYINSDIKNDHFRYNKVQDADKVKVAGINNINNYTNMLH
jgi:hypothetical protein